jgi:hypothetical protein
VGQFCAAINKEDYGKKFDPRDSALKAARFSFSDSVEESKMRSFSLFSSLNVALDTLGLICSVLSCSLRLPNCKRLSTDSSCVSWSMRVCLYRSSRSFSPTSRSFPLDLDDQLRRQRAKLFRAEGGEIGG